jgi:hypothetical protein
MERPLLVAQHRQNKKPKTKTLGQKSKFKEVK